MSRYRLIALVAAAVLLLWLRPWRRILARFAPAPLAHTEDVRPRSFARAGQRGPAAANVSATRAGPDAGFSSGQPRAAPAPEPAAQPDARGVDQALDELASSAPAGGAGAAPSVPGAADGMLASGVYDEVRGDDAGLGRQGERPVAGARPEQPADASVAGAAPHKQAEQTRARGQDGVRGGDSGSAAPQPPEESAERAVGTTRDDLLVIEGIGPKTQLIVQGAGITSFAQLADADTDWLRQLLRENGVEVLNPGTWPQQARLAADGKWDELRALQGRIKNGRIEGEAGRARP